MGSIKKSQFSIIRSPWITEKSASVGSVSNCIVLEVHKRANKKEIQEAVEKTFEVKVSHVRTVNSKGKLKKNRKGVSQESSRKKAYISLKEGNAIDIIEGL